MSEESEAGEESVGQVKIQTYTVLSDTQLLL